MEANNTGDIRRFHYAIIAETYPKILNHFGQGKNQKRTLLKRNSDLFGEPEPLAEINPIFNRETFEKQNARLTN